MIKRITNPEEYKKVIDDIDELFYEENRTQGHALDLVQDRECIKNSFANSNILAFDVFVWANQENGKYDAVGIFVKDKSIKFGVDMLAEFLWVSKNPKCGFKILKEATSLARKKNIKYLVMGTSCKNPNSPRYERLYKKLGFVEDTHTFIGKL